MTHRSSISCLSTRIVRSSRLPKIKGPMQPGCPEWIRAARPAKRVEASQPKRPVSGSCAPHPELGRAGDVPNTLTLAHPVVLLSNRLSAKTPHSQVFAVTGSKADGQPASVLLPSRAGQSAKGLADQPEPTHDDQGRPLRGHFDPADC
jgi:hypothetical protein